MLVFKEGVLERFSFAFLFPFCICFVVVVVVVVAVVAVDLNDAIMVVAALHSICDNTSSNLDSWVNKESITLSLVLTYFL